jgi:hypothetical protein
VGTSRSAQQSNLLGISYSIVDDYRARTIYALSGRSRLSAAASYVRRSLRDSPSTPAALLDTEDRTLLLQGSASYSPSYRLALSLDVSSERRRSDNRLFNYDNFLVAFTTKLTV